MMAGLSEVRRERSASQRLALRIGLLALWFVPLLFGGYPLYLATEAALLAVAAVALGLLLGHGGVPSLGQAAFLGLGAYAVGLCLKAGWPLWLGLLLAVGVAALFALVTGLLVFRTHGIFVLMLTLAFGQMVYSAAHKWTAVTGGDDGLSLSGLSLHPGLLHLGAMAVLLAVLLGLGRLLQTPYGKTLEAIRQNEEKIRSLGVPTFYYKLSLFVLTGALTGLAGGGLALHRSFISPHDLFWLTSATLMVMVLLGGSRGLWGAAFGALLYTFVQSWVSSFTDLWGVFVGLLLIGTVLFAREGLWPLLERRFGGERGGA
ncbi:MAG: branched-chain amino acid ABC transporter permease [Meiothermus sp.]|uniref:branched-chain amino acid ABC transporter permease n=1 Tax=Meiothermus sp. TaxID=1955249 RepID=UPI0025EC92BE|nr:branched-chain amino acid ABC transporter permease [Meiothermus sp.]MCS7057981.1 branched-chain amino acid ABC transporter permease [Meiothermus sp.]MCS7194525.1 branched-chain amino acid ABC transporter permease [Meiothermus sp.]MDW8091881.1 branched-chain amino acid ABC transporter permease [Meiothermus sp.]MDW8480876.1 branched-chain amino acid ABC transporter permease [Meiothermus sp.]